MNRSATYAAICARACALRAARPNRTQWQELIDLPSSREVVARLASTGLVSSPDLSARDAEYEIRQRFIEEAQKLMRFSSGDLRQALGGFVRTYDLLNLEIMICHVHGRAQGEAPRLYDTGRCGMFHAGTLAAAPNMAVIGELVRKTPLASAFDEAAAALAEEQDLESCLTVLEREFVSDWQRAARAAGFAGRSALGSFIGTWAAVAVLRLGSRGRKPYELMAWIRLVSNATDARAMLERHAEPANLYAVLMSSIFGSRFRRMQAQASRPVGQASADAARQAFICANRAQKGLRFNADFPAGFLVVGHYQAESLVALIEGKELGLKPAEIGALLVAS